MTARATTNKGTLLAGIDGTNPLGFMAAVGLLRILNGACETPPAMRWVDSRGSWRPEIRAESASSIPDLVAHVLPRLKSLMDRPPFIAVDGASAISDTLKLLPAEYRRMAVAASRSSSSSDRDWSDWLAALASETATRRNAPECMKCTFDFTAGQQKFLPMARAVIEQCDGPRLERCLAHEWEYPDTGESLRWDPIDESRRYALSAIDPTNASKNPIQTDFAANALAFAALPTFPLVRGSSLGFSPRRAAFRWPLWKVWLGSSMIVPMMALIASTHRKGTPTDLRARGVDAVFESPVVLPVGYYRNLTPARRIA